MKKTEQANTWKQGNQYQNTHDLAQKETFSPRITAEKKIVSSLELGKNALKTLLSGSLELKDNAFAGEYTDNLFSF